MRLSRQEQIAKLKKTRQERAAKAAEADKRDADRLRFLEVKQAAVERKRDTRRKIVVGGIVLAAQKSHTEISLQWLEMQIQALERPHDRRLFGPDDARENNGDDAAKKTKPATATAPPITDKQKGLLARLVEQQPEIAREIGIDPEEPGLEKLTKNEANPLIGKALERLKTEDIRLMNS